MIIDGLHEKGIFTESYPFRLAVNTEECFDYPLHWHGAVELVYAVENGYTANVGGRDYSLSEKDILIIPGGDIHGFQTRKNKGKRAFIQFDLSLLDCFGGIKTVKPFLSQIRKISSKDDCNLHTALEQQISTIINEYEKREFAYALFINARILDMLVLLSRSLSDKINYDVSERSGKKLSGLERLDRAFMFMEKNYQNDISLKDISRAAGFSESHFSRIFKEITEKNFHDYLSEYRIKKVERLLSDIDTSIVQAAHASGFNSIPTFNRAFKKVKGCTPSEYKKMRV